METNLMFVFPLKAKFVSLRGELDRYIRLIQDYETLINTGMDPEEAAKMVERLEEQYLNLENFP